MPIDLDDARQLRAALGGLLQRVDIDGDLCCMICGRTEEQECADECAKARAALSPAPK